jgi:hypothetical protein
MCTLVDEGHDSPQHLNAWKLLAYYLPSHEEDFGVVLEDDAEPIADFQPQLMSALATAPSPVVSLYLGRARPPHWQDGIASVIARPESWLMASEMLHGVGIAVRGDVLPQLLEDLRGNQTSWPVDERIGWFCRVRGIEVAYAHPSLIDHADIPSVYTKHVSQHATDALTRADTREPRRAWVVGPGDWNSSAAKIPDPVL